MRLSRRGLVGFLAIALLALATIFVPNESKAIQQGWIEHPDVRFSLVKELTSPTQKPTVRAGNNRDCTNRKVVTKPHIVNLFTPDTQPVLGDDCMIESSIGAVGGSYFMKSGTDVAGNVVFSDKKFLVGGPNLPAGILADATASIGAYLGILHNPSVDIETKVQPNKTVINELKPTATITDIKGSSGQRLPAIVETVAFSSNGNYMVFDSPNYGFVRADTTTGATISFGQSTNYNNGSNPGYNFAISADGRYVVASRSNMLNVYDLNLCTAQAGLNAHLMNCKKRELHDKRISDTNFGLSAFIVRFTGVDSFTYFTDQLTGVNTVTARQYRVTLGDVPEYNYGYLGLGDSFASGEGAFSYKTITQNKCHVSLTSYPFLVGEASNKEDYESIACSGARIEDIFQNQDKTEEYQGQIKDGISQEERKESFGVIFGNFIPGTVTQNTFLEELKPEAITLSIGGNDLAFGDKVTSCVVNAELDQTCFDTLEDRKEIAEEIYALSEDLTNLYLQLKKDNKKVYVIGYPKIVHPGGNCANNVKLNANEIAFADKLTVLINDSIEFATKQAGVFYVDVENMLDGRKLCETDSDNILVNGITQNSFGVGGEDIIAKESFHPKNDAHKLYKDAIISQTNSLTNPMPVQEPPAKMPRLLPADAFFRDLTSTGRTIYKPIYDDILFATEYLNTVAAIELEFGDTGFSPLSQVKAQMHSTPVDLGTFTTDINGNLTADITIPNTVEPGYHSIHFYGVNQTGQNIDVYDYLFVAHSEDDFDGDGILNKDEGCVVVEPSGIDTDEDGIDDACDGIKDPLPEPILEEALIVEEDPEPEIIVEQELETIIVPEIELQPTEDPIEIEEEIIVGPSPPIVPIDIPEEPGEIIGLPEITPFGPEKDVDTNGETKAGNEELAEPEPEVVASTNNQTNQVAQNNTPTNATTAPNNRGETTPEVLSETTTENESNTDQVTIPESNVNDKPPVQAVNNRKVYLYYFLVGIVAFIALVTFLLMAMRKQKPRSSS